jgi:protein PET117
VSQITSVSLKLSSLRNLFSDKLHEGVIRDVQRQQIRKIENVYNLQQQIELTKVLKKELVEEDDNSEKS